MGQFNPYQHWLGISDANPDYYTLLGVSLFENNGTRIAAAAESQLTKVRSVPPGEQMAAWCALVSELAAAMKCLTDGHAKARYDAELRALSASPGTVPDDDDEFVELPPMAIPSSGAWQPTSTVQTMAPTMAHLMAPQLTAPTASFVTTDVKSVASQSRARASRDRWRYLFLGVGGLALIVVIGFVVSAVSKSDRNDTAKEKPAQVAMHDIESAPATPKVPAEDALNKATVKPKSKWAPIESPPGEKNDVQMKSPEMAAAEKPEMKATASTSPLPKSMDKPKASEDDSKPKPSEVSPEKAEAYRQALIAVRDALGDRQFPLAKEKLEHAKTLAITPAQLDQWEQAKRLDIYVNGFWDAVRDSLKQQKGGDEIKIGNTVAAIVEATPDQLILRVAGRNVRYAVPDRIPTPVALELAEKWFDDRPDNKMFLGAFHAVDARGDQQTANRLWQEAEQAGIKSAGLVALVGQLASEQ